MASPQHLAADVLVIGSGGAGSGQKGPPRAAIDRT
jgi:hypothetical protein